MNRNAWSADGRAEHDLIVEEAWRSSSAQADRADTYLSLLRDGEQAQRFFATDCLHDALLRGVQGQLKREWRRIQNGAKLPVSYEGTRVDTDRVLGVVTRDGGGRPVRTQTLFDYCTRDQIEGKIREFAGNVKAYKAKLKAALRAIDLLDRVPEATTPAEAATALGTTVEAFLAIEPDAA